MIKTVSQGGKNHVDPWDGTESPERDPREHRRRSRPRSEACPSTRGAEAAGHPRAKTSPPLGSHTPHHHELQTGHRPSVKSKVPQNSLKMTQEKTPDDLGFGNDFLGTMPKTRSVKEIIDNLDSDEITKLCSAEDTAQSRRGQAAGWGNAYKGRRGRLSPKHEKSSHNSTRRKQR